MAKSKAWRAQRQQARTKRRNAKQRASKAAETKRQRTRAQTPDLWRSRVKGRAVKRSGNRALKGIAIAIRRWQQQEAA